MESPKIRFKGYTEDWEERKLDDVARFSKGNGYSKGDLVEEGTPIILYGRLYTNYETTINVVDTFVDEKENSVFSKGGEVVVPASGETSEDIARASAIENAGILLGGDLNVISPNESINSSFLALSISYGNAKKELAKKAQGKSVVHIHNTEIKGLSIPFPSKREQEKIAIYFTYLDNLINLHQRKCEETKKIKKYMLQKMFPQNGKNIPEIRFEGFTGAWEQRKLGEVFEQTTNFVNLDEGKMELWSLTVEDGLTPKSERYNREFLVKKDTNFKEVRPGDIVYNPMNMTLGAVGYNGMAKSVAVSGYYTTMVANAGYDSYCINTWLKSPYAISLYKTFATGSLKEKQRVQFPTLSIIPTVFPESEEQKKIGLFFERLDNLITLHQRKCDELKTLKKYMLQNMFV